MSTEHIGGWHAGRWDEEAKAKGIKWLREQFEDLIADIESGAVEPIVINKVYESFPMFDNGAIAQVPDGRMKFSVRWYDPRFDERHNWLSGENDG